MTKMKQITRNNKNNKYSMNSGIADQKNIEAKPTDDRRNSIINIQDYEGKYYVKTLELGTIIKADK